MTEKKFTKKLKDRFHKMRVDSLEGVGCAFPDLLITPHNKQLSAFLCEAKVLRGTKPVEQKGALLERGQAKFLHEYRTVGYSCIVVLDPISGKIWFYDGIDAKKVDRMRFSRETGSMSTAKLIVKSNIYDKGSWEYLSKMLEGWLEL